MIREACCAVTDFVGVACSIVIYLIRRAGEIVGPLILMPVEKWERAFVVSCIAVSLDPLFLYIPIVDERNKCLAMDKTLRTTVLIFRSLTDFLLLTHIIAQICDWVDTDYEISPQLGSKHGFHQEFDSDTEDDSDQWFFVISLIIKCLAVLPIPQVAILVGFFRMGGSDFNITRRFLNISLLLQYFPRVCQIYLSRSKFSMGGKWVKPAFNLFLYILASHVLGALWYFFAIERETSCWHNACRKTAGCIASAYKCGIGASTKNTTLLNELCPITSPNTTLFDFGMFVKVLQSGNTGSVDFPTKLFYTLWWGLKNLSNFGTNLETSSYLWENCFAILICVIGLLLFLYLIGNMQVFMQSATTNSLENEKLRQNKIVENKGEIVKWMKSNNLSYDTMETIKTAIREYKVLEKKLIIDVDVRYFLNDTAFSNRIRQPILEHLGLAALKRVPIFADIREDRLRSLCQRMNPVTYSKDTSVFIAGRPLDQMLFIIRGELECVDTTGPSSRKRVMQDAYLGEVIQKWVSFNLIKRSYCDPLPILARGYIKSCEPKVEALALNAWDIVRFAEQNFDANSSRLKAFASAHGNSTVDEIKEDPLVPSEPWKCPEPGWVKLNCSYVWNPDSELAAFGCVLRNDKRQVISVGSVGNYQFIDRFQAGAFCICCLMNYSVQHVKTGHIIVESDDKLLIDFLKKGPLNSDERVLGILRPTLQNIANEVSKFKGCKFVHCKSQTNAAAVLVAKHAVRVPDSKSWSKAEEIPGLVDALMKDSPGVVYESSREQDQELAEKVNVDSGASTSVAGAALSSQKVKVDSSAPTSAAGAALSSKETAIIVKEPQEA